MNGILVTGGLGFIGFNFISRLFKEGYNNIVCIDKITYAAKPWLEIKLKFLYENGVTLCFDDIQNEAAVERIIVKNQIDTIVNFAAETHVDNSISNPTPFFSSNILGVVSLLKAVKKFGLRFHQIGTDEVYGSVDPAKDNVDECFPLNASSPYSSAKASADLITLSYFKTFGCNVTVSRCSNNFGPWQHPEKLIPKTITNALQGKDIPVYGDGKQRRFWIHVDDHNEAVMKILENGKPGEIYNIAPDPNNLVENISIVEAICDHLKVDKKIIKHVADRPGHDLCYYLNGFKLQNGCGFKPRLADAFIPDLMATVDWYQEHQM